MAHRSEPRVAYFVNQAITDEHGEWIVCIAVEGERGYYKTDWHYNCAFQFAEATVAELNARLGVSELDATKIVLGTMRR